jgi:hypothetical protein
VWLLIPSRSRTSSTDPKKIKDIINWQEPKTLKKLRGFLGLTGYYRCFIKGYSTICQPLHQALKKDSFVWGEAQQIAFDTLKQAMTTPPLLALPNFQIPFILETDACATGVGAVIMQEGKPMTFSVKDSVQSTVPCQFMKKKLWPYC